jgi:hypothetical protein
MWTFSLQIKEIISHGIEVPEGQNDLRRQQLRENYDRISLNK